MSALIEIASLVSYSETTV